MLVGQAMSHGNLLLHGWTLPPGNYWTTDSALYAVAIRFFGLRPELLYAEPAFVGVLMMAFAAFVAAEGRRGSSAFVGAAVVVTLLTFTTPVMGLWFVGTGFHIETALYALVAMYVLRTGTFGRAWIFGVLILAIGMLGDLEIIAFAVVPLLLGGIVIMLRQRSWRGGVAHITAAVASAGLGEVGLRVARALGGFRPGPSLPLAHIGQLPANLWHVFAYGAELLGIANGTFGDGGVPYPLLYVHAVGGIFVVMGVVVAGVGLAKGIGTPRPVGPSGSDSLELWRMDDLLLFATVGSSALFVILAGANGVGTHFLSVPVVFATILAGRALARFWPTLQLGGLARAFSGAALVVVVAYAVGLGVQLSRPAPAQGIGALVTWLDAHRMHQGVGGYWASSIATVESHGTIEIRPAGISVNGTVEPLMYQSSSSWYRDSGFQFFVEDTRHSGNVANADAKAAMRTWGLPAHTYAVGIYRVMTWNHDLTVTVPLNQ